NHTFWCLNTNSGDTGGLLDSSFKVWDDEKYNLFEPSLWQTSKTGKYIGLDHQTPLGTNGTGISVSDYYKTYAESEGSNLDSDGSVNPLPTDETDPKPELKGDINLNGTIEIADLVLLNKHLIKASVLKDQALKNADVNDDNKLNVFDSIMLKRLL
ncbi:MAG: dockerin type I repeat-containing protein, partial [Oscillospiraceae bacterium]|nr:dockerin type I repeat-containing protein [Oscillospiraceae bacterium]